MTWLLLALLGCDGEPPDGDLVLGDDHNYAYHAALIAETHELIAGHDALVRWDRLRGDARGRSVPDPSAIDQVSLVALILTREEVLDAVATNDLKQAHVRDYRLFDNLDGRTSAHLSEFSILGNPFDPATEFIEKDGTWTWLLTVWQTGVDGRLEILSTVFVVPSDQASATTVAFTEDSARFDLDVDLHSAEPLLTSPGLVYTLDWSAVTEDVNGHELDPYLADQLVIGHLAGEVGRAEAHFVQLPERAEALYRLDVYGEDHAPLAEATDLDGAGFPGFTADGTWLVGLECTSCTGPAPLVMAVVEVDD